MQLKQKFFQDRLCFHDLNIFFPCTNQHQFTFLWWLYQEYNWWSAPSHFSQFYLFSVSANRCISEQKHLEQGKPPKPKLTFLTGGRGFVPLDPPNFLTGESSFPSPCQALNSQEFIYLQSLIDKFIYTVA